MEKEKFKFDKKQKIVLITTTVVSIFVGYKFGTYNALVKVSRGLDKMYKSNPDLRKAMFDALNEIKE